MTQPSDHEFAYAWSADYDIETILDENGGEGGEVGVVGEDGGDWARLLCL